MTPSCPTWDRAKKHSETDIVQSTASTVQVSPDRSSSNLKSHFFRWEMIANIIDEMVGCNDSSRAFKVHAADRRARAQHASRANLPNMFH